MGTSGTHVTRSLTDTEEEMWRVQVTESSSVMSE